jgi:hypothetical protein
MMMKAMAIPMPPDSLETLQQVNDYLRSALLRLRPEHRAEQKAEQKQCSVIRPQECSDILGQLLRAAESLRRPPAGPEAARAFEKESLDYRCNLETLKDFLPGVHERLRADKAHLEAARNHVATAAAWSRASRETF